MEIHAKKNGLTTGIVSLVLSVFTLVFSFLFFIPYSGLISLVFAIATLTLSIISLAFAIKNRGVKGISVTAFIIAIVVFFSSLICCFINGMVTCATNNIEDFGVVPGDMEDMGTEFENVTDELEESMDDIDDDLEDELMDMEDDLEDEVEDAEDE